MTGHRPGARLLCSCASVLVVVCTSQSAVAQAAGNNIETVVVTGQRYREKALQLKKAAPNVIEVKSVQEIRKLPDVNVAEALQRMPGISMEADTGEGRFINIRGMDADLNGTTFDGVELTSSNQATPQGGGRAVAFDAFPTGTIGGVEIVKSLTPDMDAEGLGGVINLVPHQPPASGESFLDAGIGSGYEPQRERPIWQGDITAGTTLDTSGDIGSGGPFGVLGSYSFEEDHRGIDDVEEAYSNSPPDKTLDNLQLRWYEYHRIRQGMGGGFTYTPNGNNTFYIRGLHAGYTEYAEKHHLELQNLGAPNTCNGDPTANAPCAVPVQTLTDSHENVGNDLLTIGGHSLIGDFLKADYRGSWTRGHDDFPTNYSAAFATPGFISLSYNNIADPAYPSFVSPVNLANPALYALGTNPNDNTSNFSQLQNSPGKSFDQEWSGAADFRFPLVFADNGGEFKFGAMARLRSRGVSLNQLTFAPMNNAEVSLQGLTVGPDIIYYDNHYNIGPNLNARAIETLAILARSDVAGDLLADGESFEHDDENVYAGYLQYTATYGRLAIVEGMRFEATNGDYHANLATTDKSGNTTLTPNVNKQDYANLFPSLQAKYTVDDSTQIRAAFSSGIARPGFNQITAAKTIDNSGFPDVAISEGNPNLKPTTGDSFDLTLEHYLPNGGIAYAGLFYKYFNNYIVPTTSTAANGNGGTTTITSFSNIGRALTEGLEMNYVQQFAFLPQPMDGLGFDANFTLVYSRGDIRPDEWHTLPQTSPFNYNAELFYEKGPLGIRLAASYVSANIFAVGSDPTQDVYAQPRFRLDLGSTYDATDKMQFYFDVKNLTNTLLEFAQTRSTNFPIQREFYGPTFFAGVRLQIGQGGFGHLTTGDEE